MGIVNISISFLLILLLVLLNTPLLNPVSIAAESQVQRLLSNKVSYENFDYHYLANGLGKIGESKLAQLAELKDDQHPHAKNIRDISKEKRSEYQNSLTIHSATQILKKR